MSDDLISRQAVIDAIYHHFPNMSRTECAEVLHEVPSAQPKKGWWVYNERYDDYRCTVCGQHALGRYNYCPDCGAKMDIEYPPKDFMNQPEGGQDD